MRTSVYLHIPFCPAKCHYCDFLSFSVTGSALSVHRYLQLLEKEMALRGAELKAGGHVVETLYIGGGTPTVLEEAQLEYLLLACRRHLPLNDAEWTVEANPGTITAQKAKLLASYGVNRISLGIQDINDCRLALLGRTHTAAQARQAFFLCREHFPTVSVDIMTGLPKQSAEDVEEAVSEVCRWQPDHISLYGLKVEEGTELASLVEKGKVELPAEEDVLSMMLAGKDRLLSHGYEHYEIANFARPGKVCRHNLTYWQNRPYLGLGLGAHSFWQDKRFHNTVHWQGYRQGLEQNSLPLQEETFVTRRQMMEDTMMLGLRLMQGVYFAEFQARFACDLRQVFAKEIALLKKQGLIVCDAERIYLSSSGYPLANIVFAQFLTV
ncbi:radical SAM family heme chaperone HemW [Dethiobacter alkaliphilus]|nr:radical SAM family heme chaperone HemW [Dethiobacter alkaliphilus]